MLISLRKNRYHEIVIFCLLLANILNLFVDRSGNEGGRQVVQLLNGFALVVSFVANFTHNYRHPHCFNYLKLFAYLFAAHFLVYVIHPYNSYVNTGNYIRLALSLNLLLLFSSYFNGDYKIRLLQLYVITFVIQSLKKIVSGHWFDAIGSDDFIGGGDTVSIGLVFCIPILFVIFRAKISFVLFVVCAVFVLLSLRRTSIIALILLIPYLSQYLKQHLNKKNILICVAFAAVIGYFMWGYAGSSLTSRFLSLINGDTNYSAASGSYGSGRSLFWMALLKESVSSIRVTVGYGLGSVHEFFSCHWTSALSHAHSDILEILHTFGIVGLLLWSMFFYSICRYTKKFKKSAAKVLLKGCLLSYTFVAIATGTILRAEFFPMAITIPLLIDCMESNRPFPVSR